MDVISLSFYIWTALVVTMYARIIYAIAVGGIEWANRIKVEDTFSIERQSYSFKEYDIDEVSSAIALSREELRRTGYHALLYSLIPLVAMLIVADMSSYLNIIGSSLEIIWMFGVSIFGIIFSVLVSVAVMILVVTLGRYEHMILVETANRRAPFTVAVQSSFEETEETLEKLPHIS